MAAAQATEAAREKQERIKERFKEWVWTDDSRRERLCRLYNDTFNHTRVRTFNGDHLTLPGASGAIQLHAHQKAGVWRILQTPNTMVAHVVGAGKTYTMVAAAMEARRLGISGKPMFVVPNHMLGQFSTEFGNERAGTIGCLASPRRAVATGRRAATRGTDSAAGQ